MKTAFLFPGQGAQSVGMGADIAASFPAAAKVFEKSNDIVGYDLSDICFNGPAEKLNRTDICQPAIFTVSAAILEALRTGCGTAETVRTDVTAGLSLGEYTALYAAGAIDFEDALLLVKRRGEAMQEASEEDEGAMVSIVGLDEQKVALLCEEAGEGELLKPVNFNCPGQVVISGTLSACKRAEQTAEKYGAAKTVRLEVAGAFHTSMMKNAAEKLREALEKISIKEPGEIKTIANISAEYYKTAKEIFCGLVKQLTEPILWQKCMEKLLRDGIENFYEIGPGRVLIGLMKRISRKTTVINAGDIENLKRLTGL